MRRIPCPTAPQATNDWLRPNEDHALQACPGTLAERFPIMLLRWSGIRAGEACALTLADLDLTPGHETLTIQTSKAGQDNAPSRSSPSSCRCSRNGSAIFNNAA